MFGIEKNLFLDGAQILKGIIARVLSNGVCQSMLTNQTT